MQRLWAWACLLATLAFIASYFVVPDFNGFTPDQFPNVIEEPPVQPSGYAFAIWGLIYLALIAHGLIGLRRGDDPDWAPTRAPLAVSLAVGATWIPVAKASPILATVLILVMLAGALLALRRAGPSDRLALATPLGLYAGWLTAASAVSLGLLAAGYGVIPGGTAALIALALALGVGLAMLRARPVIGFAAALAWAFVGVAVRNWGDAWALAALAAVAAAGVLAFAGVLRSSDRSPTEI